MNSTLKYIVLALLTIVSASYAFAADVPKAMLLRPGGWIWEFSYGGSKTAGTYLFQAREQNVVVKISGLQTTGEPFSCEHDVTIAADTVSFDSCLAGRISLHYDASDQEYPFKGKDSPNDFKYRLKAK